MKNKFFNIALMFLSVMMWGCSKETPVQTDHTLTSARGAGEFGMSYLKGLAKGLAKTQNATAVQSGENVNFNLGNIKGSTAFYFLLYNVGNTPITNVALTTNDTMFSVYPAAMDTLVPGTDVGMLPVVKISAIHGTSFDGVGYRPLMKQGLNSAVLHIQGRTKTSQGIDTTVVLSAGLNLTALVMDFKFYGRGGAINLEFPKTSLMGRFLYDSAMSVSLPSTWVSYYPENYNYSVDLFQACFKDDIRDTVMKILNTGNVPLGVTQYPSGSSPALQVSLAPGDSLLIPKAAGRYIVDGSHAVANPRRMNLHTDGKFYFQFDVPVRPTCGTYVDEEAFKQFQAATSQGRCADTYNSIMPVNDNPMLRYWERLGTCSDSSFTYTLFWASPDSIVAQYTNTANGVAERYVNQTYKDLLTQLRGGANQPEIKK